MGCDVTFANSLAETIMRAAQRISQELDTILRPEDLTLAQWRVLDALSDGKGKSVSALAKGTSIQISALSKLIDRMVVRSLVLRKQDVDDHRIINVMASDLGIEVHRRCAPRVEAYQESLAVACSEADRDGADMVSMASSLAALAASEREAAAHKRAKPGV